MEAGMLLFVVRDAVNYMEQNGLLNSDGSFGDMGNIAADLGLAAAVESSLKAHGVAVPDKVDKVVRALPAVLALVQ